MVAQQKEKFMRSLQPKQNKIPLRNIIVLLLILSSSQLNAQKMLGFSLEQIKEELGEPLSQEDSVENKYDMYTYKMMPQSTQTFLFEMGKTDSCVLYVATIIHPEEIKVYRKRLKRLSYEINDSLWYLPGQDILKCYLLTQGSKHFYFFLITSEEEFIKVMQQKINEQE